MLARIRRSDFTEYEVMVDQRQWDLDGTTLLHDRSNREGKLSLVPITKIVDASMLGDLMCSDSSRRNPNASSRSELHQLMSVFLFVKA